MPNYRANSKCFSDILSVCQGDHLTLRRMVFFSIISHFSFCAE